MSTYILKLCPALSLVMLPFLGGCVSLGTFRQLERDKNSQIEKLELEITDLRVEKASLELKVAELKKAKEEVKTQYEGLIDQLSTEIQEGQMKITQYKNMLKIEMAEKVFFDSGSATLKESGKAILNKVASLIQQYDDKIVRVVGHTDNVPIAAKYKKIFPTNWELSVIRACNVVRYLEEKGGIPPERLLAEGRGEHDPVAPNDTPEGRQQNRRIEITLIDRGLIEGISQKEDTPNQEVSPAEMNTPLMEEEAP